MLMSPEENKVFQCLNPECGRAVCRLCRSKSHLPIPCDEIEKDDEVEKRLAIERKMAEALIRECPGCHNKFFKTEGCNMMTCTCGTRMCYICRKKVKNYDHFYPEGTQPSPGKECPLFSNNEAINREVVEKAAKEAKQEMEKSKPNVKLVHDPTVDVHKENAKK